MDPEKLIDIQDILLRTDLDPRLGYRDENLVAQYAEIFDALPPIQINQHHELIDGWHRVLAARHIKKIAIEYIIIETEDDDDLAQKMWDANLKHGVQYSRMQRMTRGIGLFTKGVPHTEIATSVGVSARTVYGWTKDYRAAMKRRRQQEIERLSDQGLTTRNIAEKLGIDASTVARLLQNRKTAKLQQDPETEAEPTIEAEDGEIAEEIDAEIDAEIDTEIDAEPPLGSENTKTLDGEENPPVEGEAPLGSTFTKTLDEDETKPLEVEPDATENDPKDAAETGAIFTIPLPRNYILRIQQRTATDGQEKQKNEQKEEGL